MSSLDETLMRIAEAVVSDRRRIRRDTLEELKRELGLMASNVPLGTVTLQELKVTIDRMLEG